MAYIDVGATAASLVVVGEPRLDIIHTTDFTNEIGLFLLCDGRTLQKADYEALFNYFVGSQYQIDSNTFKLPDPRGKTLGIAGGSHGLGSSVGDETRTLITSNLPSHSHTIDHEHGSITSGGGGSHNHDVFVPYKLQQAPWGDAYRTVWEYDTYVVRTTSTAPDHTHTVDVPAYSGNSGSTGLGSSFSIMQPTAFLFNVFIYAGQQ